MNHPLFFSKNIWLMMISKYLEPHQRFQLIQVNKWFQQITKKNKLNYTMVFFVFSNLSDINIYYERKQDLKLFFKKYKALLPWINSNNVELKFLTLEEFLGLRHNSSNFMINMLILNYYVFNITHEQLEIMLNSLKLSILSLEIQKPAISNDFYEVISIDSGLLEICSKCPSLQYLQVENFEFPLILNLNQTYFKIVIFKRMCFNAKTCVRMPLCLEKFHMGLDFQQDENPGDIEFWMNKCKYIKEL
jgi:hypothetical protein